VVTIPGQVIGTAGGVIPVPVSPGVPGTIPGTVSGMIPQPAAGIVGTGAGAVGGAGAGLPFQPIYENLPYYAVSRPAN